MSKTITGSHPNGYVLADATLNPVTNTGTIALGTSPNPAALEGETIASWIVTNQGTIDGNPGSGIDLLMGGTVTNAVGAWIGGSYGVAIQGVAGSVVNAGTIDASAGSAGVLMTHGGNVTNQAGGQIIGGYGIELKGDPGTVQNAGTIVAATDSAAIDLPDGGSVTNAAGGSLSGNWGIAIQGSATASVLNDGIITGGTQSGVFLTGGNITNQAGGQISGYWGVAIVDAAGTLVTGGSIAGTGVTAVTLPAGFANRVVLEPGASFTGLVDGGNTIGATVVSTLELGTGTATGTLSGLGAKYVDFGAVVFDPGAVWKIEGSAAGLDGEMSGFARGDTIDVDEFVAQGSSFVGGILTLTGASNSQVSLDLPGSFNTGSFAVTGDGTGSGTDVMLACFAAGTSISTPDGPIPVESLRIGDTVLAGDGGGTIGPQPIVWIGHRALDCRRHPHPEQIWPVRIAAGAFGPGLPLHDLWLSPDHAVYIVGDGETAAPGVLIPIRYLINGATVAQMPVAAVTYFHVELPTHAVLLAEGLPAESYLDTGNRSAFADSGTDAMTHPAFALGSWCSAAAGMRHQ